MLLGKIDEYGKLGWLTVTVVAFWLAWPIGLLALAFLAGSGRLQAWRSEIRMPSFAGGGLGRTARWAGFHPTSGNRTFDDYRQQAINELEEEQREFQSFLEQLRAARDKAEFDAFMAQRRRRTGTVPVAGTDQN